MHEVKTVDEVFLVVAAAGICKLWSAPLLHTSKDFFVTLEEYLEKYTEKVFNAEAVVLHCCSLSRSVPCDMGCSLKTLCWDQVVPTNHSAALAVVV